MSTDEQPDSLAEQAAAWVPPWARAPVPAERAPAPEPEPPPALEPELVPAAELAPGPEPVSAPEPEPVSAPEPEPVSAPEPEPVSAPEPTPVVEPSPVRPEALALLDDGELRAALEAILLVVDEPVAEVILAQVLEQPTDRIAAVLADLSAGYTAAGHGFDLRRVAGGWRLYTRPEYAPYVERFVLDGQSARLTQAALETLAVVAYKQPVTRGRVSAIRGVNCDGVIRTLLSRGLIEECGSEPESGAYLYRTSTLFLEKLGLDSVEELPSLAPFLPDDVEEIADAQR
ncbi:SMC-Scp complex subunit ScpB [Solwaraspora sp. WMMD937]|uniref:SMC-Scp complex subunit ScpB n=1 Tax=Solwaraspora sp. WMMD937 TaxID=3016090 RepID=UPI00249A8C1F|nr:SMC-Scp complex subunit ScpB [Solwaraspora sp. WMMD937]WFE20052.1 SMC-Scp complex subunit ScpB [Solwaraspora sp. WMMD937]